MTIADVTVAFKPNKSTTFSGTLDTSIGQVSASTELPFDGFTVSVKDFDLGHGVTIPTGSITVTESEVCGFA